MKNNTLFEMLRTVIAVIISLAIAFIVIFMVSKQPLETFRIFLLGPLQSKRYIGNVIELAIPLGFAGIATAVLFKAKLFNLGAEGIFYFSGLIATIVALSVDSGVIVKVSLAIFAAAIAGALANGFTGVLKAKWNANELVISLMMNSILYGIGFYILNNYYRDPVLAEVASYKFAQGNLLGKMIAQTRIHYGLIILLVVAVIIYFYMFRTKSGFALRMEGMNSKFASYIGFKPAAVVITAHLIAGFIAGMGGAVEVVGMYDRFRWAALPGLGFDGALVALLGKNHPLKSLIAALFLAYIRIGADLMARLADVPSEMVAVIQAIIILLISATRFLSYWKTKMLMKEAA